MKSTLLQLVFLPFILCLSSCVSDDETTAPPGGSGNYGQPLVAQVGQGKVTILEGSRTVSTCTTAMPNVEETKFIEEQQQIVVKSRGAHGPATVQLFNTQTGAQISRVAAYNIRGGNPSWADGMGE